MVGIYWAVIRSFYMVNSKENKFIQIETMFNDVITNKYVFEEFLGFKALE